jgi:hypothetical protein
MDWKAPLLRNELILCTGRLNEVVRLSPTHHLSNTAGKPHSLSPVGMFHTHMYLGMGVVVYSQY